MEKTFKIFQACTSTSPGIHASTASVRPVSSGSTPNGASRKSANSGYSGYGYATQTQQPTSTTNASYSPYLSEFFLEIRTEKAFVFLKICYLVSTRQNFSLNYTVTLSIFHSFSINMYLFRKLDRNRF